MTPSANPPRKPMEEVLCSKTVWKILKLLLGAQLTPSQIAKITRVNYQTAIKCLEVLENEGILRHVEYGRRIRFYKYEDSLIAKAVLNMIDVF